MILRRIFSVLLLATAGLAASGQHVADSFRISLGYPVYSQYLQNGLVINPAYAGTRGAMSAFMSYRMQWIGTKGSPLLQSLSVHSPMKNDKVSLGLLARFMQYGVTKTSSVYADYAYAIRFREGRLSFGLQGGLDISNTDYSGILLFDQDDPVFEDNNKAYVLPNIGAGVYYFTGRYFAGLAIPSFLSYRRSSGGSTHLYHSFGEYSFVASGGAVFDLTADIKLKPSLLFDYSLRRTRKLNQFDLNLNIIYADMFWGGLSWRVPEQVVVAIFQVQMNQQIMAGISYDYPAGRMNSFSKGSTEFTLRYDFGYKVSAANPRYF